VEDGDDADHPARAENWNVPKGVIHFLAPRFQLSAISYQIFMLCSSKQDKAES
jgi:hypothetical protein